MGNSRPGNLRPRRKVRSQEWKEGKQGRTDLFVCVVGVCAYICGVWHLCVGCTCVRVCAHVRGMHMVGIHAQIKVET